MKSLRLIIIMVCLALGAAATGFAQDFPTRPLRLITANPGGSNDIISRWIAQELTSNFGQQVIVDNRGSAGGIIAAQNLTRAAADGYTILLYSSTILITPLLRDKVPYDPVKDFEPITLAAISPTILVIHPSLPAKNVKELIALAKTRPGELNYTGTTGSMNHLAAELFRARAGIDMVHVPHKGTSQALNDLVPGRVHVYFANASAVMNHVKLGTLRALAITSAKPSPLLPGIPTVSDSGLPGYQAAVMFSAFAPAKTARPIIDRWNQEFIRVLRNPDIVAKFSKAMVEPVGGTPEELGNAVKAEMEKMGKLIRKIGLREKAK